MNETAKPSPLMMGHDLNKTIHNTTSAAKTHEMKRWVLVMGFLGAQ